MCARPLPAVASMNSRKKRKQTGRTAIFRPCDFTRGHLRRLPFYIAGPMSSLDRDRMAPGAQPETVIQVPTMTLDDILVNADAPQRLDFLSIDVEGHEMEVLRGFDFDRWQPRLILLEDHVSNLHKHLFLKSAKYRLVRHTGHNGWYVPANSRVMFGWKDRLEVMRKYYLALPFRVLRNLSRRMRQPFKDQMKARRFKCGA